MTEASSPSPLRAFPAVLGLAMLAGAAAGLADALTSTAPEAGRAAGAFWGAAFGSLTALAVFLPGAVLLAGLAAIGVPLSAAGAPAAAAVLILAAPAEIAVGRHLYHRLPWGAGEVLLAAGVAAATVALCAVAAAAAQLSLIHISEPTRPY